MRKILLALLLSAAATPTPGPVPLSFPRDHASHPDAAIEWWYYTGHLADPAKHAYGFQLTFFRVGEVALAHFAWTDVSAGRFEFREKAHLVLPGIADFSKRRLDVTNESWSAMEETPGGVHRLRMGTEARKVELALTPVTSPLLQGDRGFSRKGPGPDEYSHYVSIPRLEVRGTVTEAGAPAGALTGTAWFDHEWGPGALPEAAAGWDWFAVQLDDGSELMLYRMRDRRGGATPFSSGVFVPRRGESGGTPVRLAWSDVAFRETKRWRSPRSGADYPAEWAVSVGRLALSLDIEPLVADQELRTEGSTDVVYWEGACRVTGSRGGAPTSGRAYAELTGYARRDVPGFRR
jgi:predicted secreted hydrolase